MAIFLRNDTSLQIQSRQLLVPFLKSIRLHVNLRKSFLVQNDNSV